MTSWLLTFVVVVSVNGRPVETQRTAMASTAEQCIALLRAERAALPRNARMVRPECREVWRT